MTKETEKKQLEDAFVRSLSSLYIAAELAVLDTDDERKKKKEKVVDLQANAIASAFKDSAQYEELIHKKSRWEMLSQQKLSPTDTKALLIDLSFSNPFSPYQLAYKEKDLLKVTKEIGECLGLESDAIEGIWKTRKEALDSHSEIAWGKIMMFAVGGAAVLATGGWMAAPAFAAYLGGSAGLAGAAAVSYGLALLGGGSLALGGMGMAGGLWLITGAGAIGGIMLGGGGAMLVQLGSGAAKIELVKLQVSFKEITLSGQIDRAISQNAINKLVVEQKELERKLKEEQSLNDKNSARIKEIETILETMGKSINWMRKIA